MGEIKILKCQECGTVWYLNQGVGMSATYLHCDKCGDQHVLDYPVIEPEQVPKINCECGGTYGIDLNYRFKCPGCETYNIEVDNAGFWD